MGQGPGGAAGPGDAAEPVDAAGPGDAAEPVDAAEPGPGRMARPRRMARPGVATAASQIRTRTRPRWIRYDLAADSIRALPALGRISLT